MIQAVGTITDEQPLSLGSDVLDRKRSDNVLPAYAVNVWSDGRTDFAANDFGILKISRDAANTDHYEIKIFSDEQRTTIASKWMRGDHNGDGANDAGLAAGVSALLEAAVQDAFKKDEAARQSVQEAAARGTAFKEEDYTRKTEDPCTRKTLTVALQEVKEPPQALMELLMDAGERFADKNVKFDQYDVEQFRAHNDAGSLAKTLHITKGESQQHYEVSVSDHASKGDDAKLAKDFLALAMIATNDPRISSRRGVPNKKTLTVNIQNVHMGMLKEPLIGALMSAHDDFPQERADQCRIANAAGSLTKSADQAWRDQRYEITLSRPAGKKDYDEEHAACNGHEDREAQVHRIEDEDRTLADGLRKLVEIAAKAPGGHSNSKIVTVDMKAINDRLPGRNVIDVFKDTRAALSHKTRMPLHDHFRVANAGNFTDQLVNATYVEGESTGATYVQGRSVDVYPGDAPPRNGSHGRGEFRGPPDPRAR